MIIRVLPPSGAHLSPPLPQDKCTRYWPAQGTEGYGCLEVSLVHQTVEDTYSEATLSLRNMEGGEVRSVRHYRLTCWPTQGVPKDTKPITKFLR